MFLLLLRPSLPGILGRFLFRVGDFTKGSTFVVFRCFLFFFSEFLHFAPVFLAATISTPALLFAAELFYYRALESKFCAAYFV